MFSLSWFPLILVSLALFQSCGSFEADKVRKVYPYSSKPEFFHDLKLVSVEKDEANRENFTMDLALSFSENPQQPVSFRVDFSTIALPGVCATQEGTVEPGTNHIRLFCLMPTPDELYVRLTLVGPAGERLEGQYRF